MQVESTDRLRLTEIFLSLQGEARSAGWPTVFVRLTGCPLRCQYCDTAYAFHGGEWWDIDAILAEVASHGVRHVCVTGGEPLAQKRCIGAAARSCAMPATRCRWKPPARSTSSDVDLRVSRVLDIKTPGSGEAAPQPARENLPLLTAHDQVKFVICDRARLRLGARPSGRASPRRALRRAVFAELQPGRRRANWPSGSWPTGCRCVSRCSCTNSCGATSRDADDMDRIATTNRARGAGLRRHGFGGGAGDRARAGLRLPCAERVSYGQRHTSELVRPPNWPRSRARSRTRP